MFATFLASAGVTVNGERCAIHRDVFVRTVNTALGASAAQDRIKTITVHRHKIQTNTVLKSTQQNLFFFQGQATVMRQVFSTCLKVAEHLKRPSH